MFKSFLAFGISIFFLLIPASAQKPGLIFHHISVNDGLSENTIRDIEEDKRGFMWFGTEDGLNKYDGYKFKVYRKDPNDIYSISSSSIKFFYTDSKQNLWILTMNGLNIYDNALDLFYNFKNNKYPALKPITGGIESIVEDAMGNIWVASGDGTLFKITSLYEAPKKYNFISQLNNKLLYSIMPDTDTTLWIGTRDGLLKFNTVTEKFTDLRSQYGQGYEVRSMYKDKKNNLWLLTTNGLRIITKTGAIKEYLHNPSDPYSINGNNLMEVIPYKDGNYLIGIDGGGIDYFDVKNQKFYHYTDENESQLSSNNIICIYKDSKNDIWSGTYLNGINFSNPTTNLFILVKNNTYSDKTIKKGIITDFLKDRKGNLWISTDGGGLYMKNKSSANYTHYQMGDKGLSSNSIISILEDPEGDIWLTTYGGGLCKFDIKKETFKVYKSNPSDIHSISNDKIKKVWYYNNKIWISTYGTGLSIFDKKTERFRHLKTDKFYPQSIPSDWALCNIIDKQKNLWIGSYKGLSKYDPVRNTFKNYTFEDKIASAVDINSVIDIFEDKEGNFWLGTIGGLILFNKKTGSYQLFTTKDGLSNNFIKGMIADNHYNIWLSTNNGITQFNTFTKKGKAYTIKDGVPPCSFYFNSKYKDEQGRIYFGANNGYLVIDPKMTAENKKIPPIVITELKIFNKPIYPRGTDSPLKYDISETKEITLSYDQNSITFEFAALNFNSSQNNKYAYWLEGFEDKWILAGSQRTATYTNLNPGTYIFNVKGSNNDNLWNEDDTSIKIIITPPYWKTWWFNSIIVTVLLLCLYLLYAWRTRNILNKNVLLEKTVKQRTRELKDANEQLETFVYKASHDIKGPLRSIIGLTTVGKKDVSDPTALNYFDHILKSTKKLDTLLRDLLEVTKVKQATIQKEKINFKELVSEALASFENFPGYDKMIFNIDIKESKEFQSDKKLLYSLVQNLIENPIKYADFSKPENTLSITINVSEKGVDLIFKDNGIGIPEEFQKKVFDMFFKVNDSSSGTGLGLYIIKTTVEKLNGSIHLESATGKGSTFYVKL